MRAYDGTQWSSWVQQTITDLGKRTPVITISNATPTIAKGQTETLASVFSASDPDGDAITQYQLYFGIGSNPPLGVVTLNGTPIATQQAVTVSSLNGLVYTGSATPGTDRPRVD